MTDDEFEVCFDLLLSVMLAKRRMLRMPVRVTCPSHIPEAQKKKVQYPGEILITRRTT
jgi:hypothetical protein